MSDNRRFIHMSEEWPVFTLNGPPTEDWAAEDVEATVDLSSEVLERYEEALAKWMAVQKELRSFAEATRV